MLAVLLYSKCRPGQARSRHSLLHSTLQTQGLSKTASEKKTAGIGKTLLVSTTGPRVPCHGQACSLQLPVAGRHCLCAMRRWVPTLRTVAMFLATFASEPCGTESTHTCSFRPVKYLSLGSYSTVQYVKYGFAVPRSFSPIQGMNGSDPQQAPRVGSTSVRASTVSQTPTLVRGRTRQLPVGLPFPYLPRCLSALPALPCPAKPPGCLCCACTLQ